MKKPHLGVIVLVFLTSLIFSPLFLKPVQAAEPIPISTPDELNNVRKNLSGDYQLVNDIDMSSFGNWTPIGKWGTGAFAGTFDGNGYTISNLTISHPDLPDIGLFGWIVSAGTVKNLQITSATVTGYNYVGICAGGNKGIITNVTTHGVINGLGMVGGLVGYNDRTITNSYAITSLTGNSNFGGLVGYNLGNINYSYAASSITKLGTYSGGGLVGYNSGLVSNSYYDSDVAGVPHNNIGTPLSTANMKKSASFAGWSFTNRWHIIEDVTYPILFPFDVTITKSSSQSDPTTADTIHFSAVFDKPIESESFTPDDVVLGGTAGASSVLISEITPNNGTTFNLAVSGMTNDGTVSVSIPEGRFIIGSNNFNNASNATQNVVNYDKTAPTVSLSSSTSSPTNSSPIPLTITFSEEVINFTFEDILVSNGTVSNFSGSGRIYTANIIPSSDGTVSVDIPANAAEDLAGNGNEAASQFQIEYDTTAPEVTIYLFSGYHTRLSVIFFHVAFSEDVIGFNPNEILAVNGSITGFIYDYPSLSTLLISPNAEGLVTVAFPEGIVTDRAGNSNISSNQISVEYDITPPTVTINQSSSQNDPTKNQPIHFTAIFSEPILSYNFLKFSDLSINGVSGTPTIIITEIAPNDGTSFDIAVSGLTQSDTVSVSLLENEVNDLAGNYNLQSTSTDNSVDYDITSPTVTISTSVSDLTNLSPVPISINFSETVIGFELTDIAVTNGTAGNFSGSDDFYTVDITPTVDGLITMEIPENVAQDRAGNTNVAATPLQLTYDGTIPTVSIEQAAHQNDPTNTLPILFTVKFSKPISMESFTVDDFNLQAPAGATITSLSEIEPNDDTTFEVEIDGLTEDGPVMLSIPEGQVQDLAGNENFASTSSDNSVTYDVSNLDVTIEKSEHQNDPTNTLPILFTVKFSKPISMESFTVDDFNLQAPAGATITSISEIEPNDDTTFEVKIDGLTEDGLVTLSLPGGKVQDLAGNDNTPSPSSENSVLYDTQSPNVAQVDIEKYYEGNSPDQFEIMFTKPMFNPDGDTDPDDVTNPENYLLVEQGNNLTFDTTSCKIGVQEDDLQIKISSVEFDEESLVSTLKIGKELSEGSYRLFICGSATLYDTAMNPLNAGLDYIYSFTVLADPEEIDNNNPQILLPETGFPIGQTSILAKQQSSLYANMQIMLEIPDLGIKTQIVGVPQFNSTWDVSWLGNQAGYLYGSAYPTWQGNTVITGHVWDANNTPGVFFNLKKLKYGDQIQIHAYGIVYTYEVRENRLISEKNLDAAFKSEEYDWVTLVTCEGYQPDDKTYDARRIVRAVLVSVK